MFDPCEATLTLLDANRQPVTGGAEPAFVRFEGVAGHFSTYAVAITAPGEADLALTKTGPPGRNPTGRNMTYTLTVTNNGPDAAEAVVVTDSLPATVTFVSATPNQGTCSAEGDVTCELGAIGSGASASIDIVVKPTQAGSITNVASVTALTIDPVGENNSDSEVTSICRITSRRSSIPCG